jgi:nicotinamidase/pyrazinamidase
VRDALALGYHVMLLQDAIRAVDVKPGDGERAIAAMVAAGATAVKG